MNPSEVGGTATHWHGYQHFRSNLFHFFVIPYSFSSSKGNIIVDTFKDILLLGSGLRPVSRCDFHKPDNSVWFCTSWR